jgi:hypothetical protein
MKLLRLVLVAIVFVVNLIIAQPSWADSGKFIKTHEYKEVTQAIADVLNPDNPLGLKPEAIPQKLADLRFQKYVLETADDQAQIFNKTGKTLAIYARPKKAAADPTLYYLGAGESIDDDYAFSGIYLPEGGKVALDPTNTQGQELTEAIAFKFVPGTQLVATANPDGVIEFNAPVASVVKAGETSWSLPKLTQAEIEAKTPNAPQD